jgi:hypothetical protein
MIYRKELRHRELSAKLVCKLSEPYDAKSISKHSFIHLNLNPAWPETEAEEGQDLVSTSTVCVAAIKTNQARKSINLYKNQLSRPD